MQTIFIIAVVAGAILGFFLARASDRRKPIRPGVLNWLLHYVAAAAMTGIPVAVLSGLFIGHLFRGVLIGLGCLVFSALALLAHGVYEYRNPAPGS